MRAEVSGAEADDDECAICMERELHPFKCKPCNCDMYTFKAFTNNRKVTGCGHEFCSGEIFCCLSYGEVILMIMQTA